MLKKIVAGLRERRRGRGEEEVKGGRGNRWIGGSVDRWFGGSVIGKSVIGGAVILKGVLLAEGDPSLRWRSVWDDIARQGKCGGMKRRG